MDRHQNAEVLVRYARYMPESLMVLQFAIYLTELYQGRKSQNISAVTTIHCSYFIVGKQIYGYWT